MLINKCACISEEVRHKPIHVSSAPGAASGAPTRAIGTIVRRRATPTSFWVKRALTGAGGTVAALGIAHSAQEFIICMVTVFGYGEVTVVNYFWRWSFIMINHSFLWYNFKFDCQKCGWLMARPALRISFPDFKVFLMMEVYHYVGIYQHVTPNLSLTRNERLVDVVRSYISWNIIVLILSSYFSLTNSKSTQFYFNSYDQHMYALKQKQTRQSIYEHMD